MNKDICVCGGVGMCGEGEGGVGGEEGYTHIFSFIWPISRVRVVAGS